MNEDLEKELHELLAGLTERERTVLRERFGIGIDPSRDLIDLAEQFTLTRERIRDIEQRALSRLRDPDDEPPSAA
jgi:DNA-directed RNA polymerase sigma subunit (sigma70/sigma32)